MKIKMPSSLKWLANKRARTAYKLELYRRRLDVLKSETVELESSVQSIQADLDAIDCTISMHEIQLNPEKMPFIQSKPRHSKFGNKSLTKLMVSYLKSQGDQWMICVWPFRSLR